MKKLVLLYIILLTFVGCVKDNTNENFKALNEVTITGIQDKYEDVHIDKVLNINPVITTSLNDDSKYKYFWIAYNENTYYNADTLSHSKDLNITINMAPGEYTMKFKAVDTETGVFYEKEFTVNIVNDFTNGVLILCQNGGNAILDFWNPTSDELFSDIYSKLNNGGSLGKNPKHVYFNKYYSDAANEVLILCQDDAGGKFLNAITMMDLRTYKDFFLSVPDVIKPQVYYKSGMREYLVNNGLVYDRATNSVVPSSTVKPNLSVPGKTYFISENADFGDNEDLPSRMVLYDDVNQCFYSLYNISTAFLTTITKTRGINYISGGYFDPDNVGMKCLYANISARSNTGAKEYMGVFETPSGERHLLKMGIGFWVDNATPSTYFKDLGNDVISSEGISDATSFACSAQFSGYMFYTVGGTIYLYNAISKTGMKIYDMGSNININHIELERAGSHLWVAYQDNSKQTLKAGFASFLINTDGGVHFTITSRHDGVADRIVDFESKY